MENAFNQPQRIVVLGGTSDIARGITKLLVAERARVVVLAGRSEAALEVAAGEIEAAGASAPIVTFDALDVGHAGDAVSKCFDAAGGPVDLVIMAVGLLGNNEHDMNDPVAAGAVASVNYAWPVAALAEVRRRLVGQGTGRILVMSSVAGIRVRPAAYLYGSAKAGLDRMADAMADTLAGTGVTLQILRPGFVHSKMTEGLSEQPFATDVDTVAAATVAALKTNKRVITVPGILRYAFFVLRHLPRPIWLKVASR